MDKMIYNFENREYLIFPIVDKTEFGSAGRYVTVVNNQVFSGFIVKDMLSIHEKSDYIFLNSILKTAKKVSNVEKGSNEDIGRKSIEVTTFSESDFE